MKNDMEKQFPSFIKEISENIYYHKLRIRFSPTENIESNYWIGSTIRNNLLYAASQYKPKTDVSLLDLINLLPIDNSHPFFQELSGGFPKGYSLTNVWNNDSNLHSIILQKNEIYAFSICLIGKITELYTGFIEAIRKMCERGIGTAMIPLNLIDICEVHPLYPSRLIYTNGLSTINPLSLPVIPENFNDPIFKDKTEINIRFITPVGLTQNKEKKNQDISFQDKQNGFPSFYQLTRSVMYRLTKLSALYSETDGKIFNTDNMELLDEWLHNAATPVLTSADIRRINLISSPKKGSEHRMKFYGYVGDMNFYGFFGNYIPLLLFSQDLGAGNDVVYGMGEYRIENNKIRHSAHVY